MSPFIYFSLRAWDPVTDTIQFEHNGVIKSRTRHRVPMVKRTTSKQNISVTTPLNRSMDGGTRMPAIKEPEFSDTSRRNSFDRFYLFYLFFCFFNTFLN